MKKNTPKRLWYTAVIQRQHNNLVKKLSLAAQKESRRKKRRPKDTVYAPALLCIYNVKTHRKTTDFLQKLRNACKIEKQIVTICFRNTQGVTAAACILMLAEVDRLVSRYGASRFRVSPPVKKIDKYGNSKSTVDMVLHQVGLYKLLGQNPLQPAYLPPNVECWRAESGVVAESETAGQMLKAIASHVPKATINSLYRGAVEALSNCVEHAYPSLRMDGLNIACKKWWMFTAVIDRRLVVIVCDLGVGIPNTIHRTQPQNLIEQIFSMFKFTANNEAGWIKTATLVKETRTQETNRGKGGGDLRNLIKVNTSARLSIFSNKGYYLHTTLATKNGKGLAPEFLMDHKNSILGTIVEWSVDIGSITE